MSYEFLITVLVLWGSFLIVMNQQTSEFADSGAAAVATLVIGFWFGRQHNGNNH
jgi:hypothetical protein